MITILTILALATVANPVPAPVASPVVAPKPTAINPINNNAVAHKSINNKNNHSAPRDKANAWKNPPASIYLAKNSPPPKTAISKPSPPTSVAPEPTVPKQPDPQPQKVEVPAPVQPKVQPAKPVEKKELKPSSPQKVEAATHSKEIVRRVASDVKLDKSSPWSALPATIFQAPGEKSMETNGFHG